MLALLCRSRASLILSHMLSTNPQPKVSSVKGSVHTKKAYGAAKVGERYPIGARDEVFNMQVVKDHQEMLRPAVAALAELERQAQITFFDVQSNALI